MFNFSFFILSTDREAHFDRMRQLGFRLVIPSIDQRIAVEISQSQPLCFGQDHLSRFAFVRISIDEELSPNQPACVSGDF